MRAMVLNRIVSLRECDAPLELVELPEPAAGDVLVRLAACGDCHIELRSEGALNRKRRATTHG